MKIIYHNCIDGYITECQFEDNRSRLFATMQDAHEYVNYFHENVANVKQLMIEQECSKYEVIEKIKQERVVENV